MTTDAKKLTEHDQLSAADKAFILRAYVVAARAHAGRKRASGDAYITHPVAVASQVADLGFDARTISAALLHDVLEDTPVTKDELTTVFGSEVAFLVDSVTKLKAIRYRGTGPRKSRDPQIESLKKMFLAMAEDIRVIIIKLADRLHNMQTLEYKEPAKRARKALETLEIYAPIADRLGMGRLKGELEDLAFPYAYPAEYAWLKRTVKSKYEQRLKYIQRTAPIVKRTLIESGVRINDIHARAKRKWSLYKKLQRYEMDPDKVMDLVALRIIVPEVKDCYEALGIIHANYKPLPGRVKDYIAVPKPNGYRSLHTTVFCEKGRIAEIQIRTADMHEHAENGIAAHWHYDEQGKPTAARAAAEAEVAWVDRLKKFLADIRTSTDLGRLKADFLHNHIFVFTPKGDVKDLPAGATPVDFAYAIHSDVGHSITGACVNDRIVPLNRALQSGDMVEVIKSKRAKPSWDWLKFVQTAQARRLIRSWFKRNDPSIAIADGKKVLNKELGRVKMSIDKLSREQVNVLLATYSEKSLNDLLTTVSMGGVDAADIVRRLYPEAYRPPQQRTKRRTRPVHAAEVSHLVIGGQVGLDHRIGKCCSPAQSEAVVGYITRARGVTVHSTTCTNLKQADKERLLDANWN